jgi:hypothetical protein
MFRKQMALCLAMALLTICFGCADELNAPNPLDEAPVLPPTNVRAYTLGDGSVQVLWDASSQPTVTGYNLYRRIVSVGTPKRINASRILDTEYLDNTTGARVEYEYRLVAVDSKGKESRFTAIVVETRSLNGDGAGKGIVPNTD